MKKFQKFVNGMTKYRNENDKLTLIEDMINELSQIKDDMKQQKIWNYKIKEFNEILEDEEENIEYIFGKFLCKANKKSINELRKLFDILEYDKITSQGMINGKCNEQSVISIGDQKFTINTFYTNGWQYPGNVYVEWKCEILEYFKCGNRRNDKSMKHWDKIRNELGLEHVSCGELSDFILFMSNTDEIVYCDEILRMCDFYTKNS